MKKTLKSVQNKKAKALIFVVGFAIIGAIILIFASAASGTATLSLSPASGSYDISTNFTVGVFENSGTDQAAGVDAKITYDTTKLDVISVDTTGAAFTDCPSAPAGANGIVTIACVKFGSSFTGSQKIGNITFKTKVGTGTTSLAFGSNSVIVKNDGSTNIWNGIVTGGTYSLTTPDTTPPTVNITAPTANAVVEGSAVALNATATDDSGNVSKVEFYVNGVLKSTDTASPYSYSWDSKTVSDGTYPVVVKAYDNAPTPNVGSATVNIQVKNNKPNLVVSSISLSPTNPKPGDIVTFSAVITNNGTANTVDGTSYATGFTVDTTEISAPADTVAIAVGASRTITTTWTATLGAHSVIVNVDKNNTIGEVNETDNSKTQAFDVKKPGDANADGVINIYDASILSLNWNLTGRTFAQGDFDGNGTVNIYDAAILSINWGK